MGELVPHTSHTRPGEGEGSAWGARQEEKQGAEGRVGGGNRGGNGNATAGSRHTGAQ